MSKFIMMLGLLVLVFSCGQQQVPGDDLVSQQGPQNIGTRFELSEVKTFNKDEKNAIKSACKILGDKEQVYKNKIAGKDIIFEFSTQKQACGNTIKTQYLSGAKIEYRNGVMVFEKMANGAIIFNDIILKNFGPLKYFCDRLESNALDKRYIHSGNTINIIYAVGKGNRILIAVASAFSYNSEGNYKTESYNKFLINNSNNKYKGFVLQRSVESSAGCSGPEKSKFESKLLKVNNY